MNFNGITIAIYLSIFMFLYKIAECAVLKVGEYVFIIGNNLELQRGFTQAPGNKGNKIGFES